MSRPKEQLSVVQSPIDCRCRRYRRRRPKNGALACHRQASIVGLWSVGHIAVAMLPPRSIGTALPCPFYMRQRVNNILSAPQLPAGVLKCRICSGRLACRSFQSSAFPHPSRLPAARRRYCAVPTRAIDRLSPRSFAYPDEGDIFAKCTAAFVRFGHVRPRTILL